MRPKEAQTFVKERRSTVRENVRIPAKISFQNKTFEVTVVDMSERGLAVNGPANLAGGTVVEMEISLPGASQPIQCNGVVAWSTKEMAGVEFSFMAASSAEALDEWLKDQSPSRVKVGR